MERRTNSLGCIVAGLGVVLAACLLPYLISSVYSVASTLLQHPTATRWLWGDWLSTFADPRGDVYRLLVELPICCVGAVGLLVIVLGVALMLGVGEPDEEDLPPQEDFLPEAEGEYPRPPSADPGGEGQDISQPTW
jgi:hypothetical protein